MMDLSYKKLQVLYKDCSENKALIYNNIVFTYNEFYKKINTLENCLKDIGITQNSRVGILLGNNPEFIVSLLALAKIGHFEAISWAFTILMIVSIIYSGMGIYNFVIYGNCDAENSQEACVYTGLGNVFNIDVGCESPLSQNKECKCKGEINCQEKESDLCKESCYK